MAYTKQTFEDGKVLTAAQLNHMEDGIAHMQNSPHERLLLIDAETSKIYRLYVSNGKLTMEEVI